MGIHVRIEQLSDHALVLRLVLGRVRLEEFDAPLAQSDCYLHSLIPKCKFMGWGKKVGNNPIIANRFIRVF